MASASQVILRAGDVAKASADVLVIPTTTTGSFGWPWRRIVQDFDVSEPIDPMPLGGVDLVELSAGHAFEYLAFAATVEDAMPTSPSIVRRIGRALGELTIDGSISEIVTPALGAGVGELDIEQSFEALVAGFVERARSDAKLVVAVRDQANFAILSEAMAQSKAERRASAVSGTEHETIATTSAGLVEEDGSIPRVDSESKSAVFPSSDVAPRETPVWVELGDDVQNVIRLADACRQWLNSSELHMERLVWALKGSDDPGVPGRWRDVDIASVAAVERQLGTAFATNSKLPGLRRLPKMSEHVDEALAAARQRTSASQRLSTADVVEGVLEIGRCSVVAALLDQLREGSPLLASPTADTVPDEVAKADRLNLHREVEMMATVMLARQTPLPLAIGLFGEWGSGKSFFMAMMRERMRELAEMSKEGRPEAADFCSRIRQIEFNAWHYVDGNLWASLAATIFDGLVVPPDRDLKREKADQLGLAKQDAIAADERVQEAERQVRLAQRKAEGLSAIGSSAVPAALDAVRNLPDIEQRLDDLGAEFSSRVPAEQVLAAVTAASTLRQGSCSSGVSSELRRVPSR